MDEASALVMDGNASPTPCLPRILKSDATARLGTAPKIHSADAKGAMFWRPKYSACFSFGRCVAKVLKTPTHYELVNCVAICHVP